MENTEKRKMGIFAIFMMIFKISAFTLGGGPVMIGLIKEAIDRTGLLPEEQTTDMIALSLAAPGAVGVAMAYQAGLALGGGAGAAAAVFAMALPPFIAIFLLSSWLLAHMGSPFITAFFNGATAALVIVLGAIVWKLAKKNALSSLHNTILCLAVAAAVLMLKVSPVWGLIVGTFVGVIVNLFFEKKEKKGEKA
ncbi:MAG: chromate transporter [Pyramidobacter sp.]